LDDVSPFSGRLVYPTNVGMSKSTEHQSSI
jgi:hypothetical protein